MPMTSILNELRNISRARGAPLPSGLRRKAVRTAFALAFRGESSTPGENVHATVCGFDVTASTMQILRLLFEEIFINPSYAFDSDRPDPVVFDCGSNIGLATLFFKSIYPDCRITAFEPSPQAYELLTKNVEANSLKNVTLHQLALGRTEGTIPFYLDPRKPASPRASTIENRLSRRERIDVRQARLSTFIDGEVDFLKLDVEGAEFGVIEELAESGAIRHIRQMVIEFHHHVNPECDDLGRFLRLIEESGFGYQVGSRIPRTRGIPQSREFQDVAIFAYRKDVAPTVPSAS